MYSINIHFKVLYQEKLVNLLLMYKFSHNQLMILFFYQLKFDKIYDKVYLSQEFFLKIL